MRIVVTGTRHATEKHWNDVEAGLIVAVAGHVFERHTLIHGDGRGVDQLAAAVVEQWGWQVIAIPARWSECDTALPEHLGGCPRRPHRRFQRGSTDISWCPYAGPRRNQQMADLEPRADLAVAFPAVGSHGRGGTWDAMRRFVDAGIQVCGVYPLEVPRG